MAVHDTFLTQDAWIVVGHWALILVGLLAVSRLFAFVVRPGQVWKLTESQWRTLAWGGMVLILIVTVPWTIFAVTDASARVSSWGYLATTSLVSVAGVVGFGLGLGTRLRMRLTVRKQDGSEDGASASYVVSRMSTMGHNRPRGLEAPQGTDVLNLPQEAVAALPSQGQIAAGLMRFALTLFAVAPWRADIVLVDASTATIEVRRNGGQFDSTLIFRSELGLDEFDAADSEDAWQQTAAHDVLTAAAAFLLMKLSVCHPDLKKGLCGTQRWRSLAFQVLAGTPPWHGQPRVEAELFARAVEKDPGNDAAWLGYLCSRAGTAVGALENEQRYVNRLQILYNRLKRKAVADTGYLALGMRTGRTLVAALLNYGLLLSMPGKQKQFRRARDVCAELRLFIEQAEKSDEKLQIFAAEMKQQLDILDSLASRDSGYGFPEHKANQPSCYYLQACGEVARGRYAKALDHLDLALGLKEYRVEALTDPSLRPLWRHPKYGPELAALVDRPQLADIEVFNPYTQNMRKAGIHFPEELLDRDPTS